MNILDNLVLENTKLLMYYTDHRQFLFTSDKFYPDIQIPHDRYLLLLIFLLVVDGLTRFY